MNALRSVRSVAVLAAAAVLSGCIASVKTPQDTALTAGDRRALAVAVADGWYDTSALAARRLLEEYGAPDVVRSDYMVWHRSGPWLRTVVRNVLPPLVEGPDLGVIEQTVGRSLTPGQAADVSAIDGRTIFDAKSGELTARSDSEELNYLRLNLAGDVVDGRLSVEEARRAYVRDVDFDAAGKNVPDMHGLRFPSMGR